MSFTDKSILCPDCGTTFTFTAGEQEFYASKGFTNDPKRCLQCRQAKKQQRSGSNGGWNSDSSRFELSREY
ncbi:MAG: zinc-ribbon domain-containing protein [Dehalococcoidia bacterium]|jgi:hypothetical protein